MSTAPAPAGASIPLPVGRLVGVGAVIFLANAALLVLQLVAGRLLSPYVGSSLETWTAIIGVFLIGIALGNAFGGKLADRYPTPKTLAVLLAVGGLAALWMLLFPWLLGATGLYKSLSLTPRIPVLAAVLCLPAGFVLSLLTPLAIKLGLPDVGHTGRVAGLIFALSTLGCLLGNYVTGFYLIPAFTINVLVLASAGALFALAGLTLVVVRPQPADRALAPALAEVLESAAFIFTATVEKLDPNKDKPEVTFKLAKRLKGEPPLERVTVDATGEDAKTLFDRLDGKRVLVFFVCQQGESYVARAFVEGSWFSLAGTPDADGKTIRWARLHGAPFLRRTFKGTSAELVQVTEGALAKATPPPEPDDTEAPGYGPPVGGPPGGEAPAVNPFAFPAITHAYLIVFLASFCGMTLELTASRMLAQQLGVSLFTWTGIIGVMLAGTALGNFVGGQVADGVNNPKSGLNPRLALAWTLCSAAGTVVLALLVFAVLSRNGAFETLNGINQVLAWTFSLFFLPMFVLGLVSPQVIRLAVPDVAHAGRVAGRVYAWSTTGAIFGTFAAGYFLLSTLGMRNTLLLAGLILICTSMVVAKVWENNPLLYLFSIVLGGVVGGFILSVRSGSEEGVVAQVESNYYTIRVTAADETGVVRRLNLDRLLHSQVNLSDPSFLYYAHEHIQMEFLQLARAATPEPRALVIGGGGYTFPRYAQELMPESQVDVVEIDPKVTAVARDHLGLKDYPNMRAIHMDGRQFVAEKVAPGTYDLVIQDAVNDYSVPAHLMTKEYNDTIKTVLKKDGVYLLTIIDSIGYGKLWKAAMATLRKSFPAENVVLLTAEVPATGAAADDWDQNRRVLVIYASDKPFNLDQLRGAVIAQITPDTWPKPTAAALAADLGSLGLPGSGPAPFAARAGLSVHLEPYHRLAVRTEVVPAARLEPFIAREPGVILTDQFCPIDNLMAEVFRKR